MSKRVNLYLAYKYGDRKDITEEGVVSLIWDKIICLKNIDDTDKANIENLTLDDDHHKDIINYIVELYYKLIESSDYVEKHIENFENTERVISYIFTSICTGDSVKVFNEKFGFKMVILAHLFIDGIIDPSVQLVKLRLPPKYDKGKFQYNKLVHRQHTVDINDFLPSDNTIL